jgi:glycerol kinase
MRNEGTYVAAIDAGTTGERVAIFSPEGEIIAWKYLEHDSFFPKPA